MLSPCKNSTTASSPGFHLPGPFCLFQVAMPLARPLVIHHGPLLFFNTRTSTCNALSTGGPLLLPAAGANILHAATCKQAWSVFSTMTLLSGISKSSYVSAETDPMHQKYEPPAGSRSHQCHCHLETKIAGHASLYGWIDQAMWPGL